MANKIKYLPRKEEIAALYQEGKSLAQISAILGLNYRTIKKGLGVSPKPIAKEKPKKPRLNFSYYQEIIVDDFLAGATIPAIAKKVNLCPRTIVRGLRNLGYTADYKGFPFNLKKSDL